MKIFTLVVTCVNVNDGYNEWSVWSPQVFKFKKDYLPQLKNEVIDIFKAYFYDDWDESQIVEFEKIVNEYDDFDELSGIVGENIDDEIVTLDIGTLKSMI